MNPHTVLVFVDLHRALHNGVSTISYISKVDPRGGHSNQLKDGKLIVAKCLFFSISVEPAVFLFFNRGHVDRCCVNVHTVPNST